MPINTLKQAAIDMSAEQAIAIGDIVKKHKDDKLPVVSLRIEETNIANAVALISQRGTSIIDHKGNVTIMDKRGA